MPEARAVVKSFAPIMLLCERQEIAEFLREYIVFLSNKGIQLPKMQIINVGSLEELPAFLNYLQNKNGLENIEKIRLFADASNKMRNRTMQVEILKNKSFLKSFKEYSYYLFPTKKESGYWASGYLEDLLIKIIKHDTAEEIDFYNLLNAAQDYLLSINGLRGRERALRNYNRHLLGTFFAGTEAYVGKKLGTIIKEGAFDLDSEELEPLKDFILALK